jgi:glucose-1-phosphate cytidylyltransferase
LSDETKVVILCGGEGTRLREETETKPKPMVLIGGMPILLHIMKSYANYGYKDFVLCLGYKSEVIKQFFLTHELMHNDFTINLSNRKNDIVHKPEKEEDWTITFAETGLKNQTGSRIKRIEKYIKEDNFLATYGDAVSTVDIPALVKFHNKQNTIGTLTAVHPHSKWGLVKSGSNGLIEEFVEKPFLYDYVNGGFFAFKADFFDYLKDSEDCILEAEPFAKLVKEKQFSMFKHEGFWHSMDTYKDYLELNKIWDSGKAQWKRW